MADDIVSGKRLATTEWKLLRTSDGADTDYAGTNADPADGETSDLPKHRMRSLGPSTHIEAVAVQVDAGGVLLDRATTAFNMRLVTVINRITPAAPSAPPVVADSAEVAGIPNRTIRFPVNGATRFSLTMDTPANLHVNFDHFDIWYREVVQ